MRKVIEVHFVVEEDEEAGVYKWLANYTEGMHILYAFTREYSEEDRRAAEESDLFGYEEEVEDDDS